MLRVGGVMVAPVDSALLLLTKGLDGKTRKEQIASVAFSELEVRTHIRRG